MRNSTSDHLFQLKTKNTLLAFYNSVFTFGFPVTMLAIFLFFFQETRTQLPYLFLVSGLSLLCFKLFQRNVTFRKYHKHFHHLFLIIYPIVSLFWFIQNPERENLIILIGIVVISGILILNRLILLIYIIVFCSLMIGLFFSLEIVNLQTLLYAMLLIVLTLIFKVNTQFKLVQENIYDTADGKISDIELFDAVHNFKNIVENSPASILIFMEEKLVYTNSHGEKLYQQKLNNNSINLYDIFPKNQQALIEELTLKANDNKSAYAEIALEEQFREKLNISATNIIYDNKSALLLTLVDITLQNKYNIQKIRTEIAEETNKKLFEEIQKHKETQLDLVENTSKLNALFESSSNLFILTIDRDLNISSFNNSFSKMMKDHFDVEVNIGNDFLKTFPIEQEAYRKLIRKFKHALRGESVEIISCIPSNQGELWVESFISPIKVENEPIKEIAFIAHNITEKIESEKKVMDSEANNRAMVSAIPDMLFKVDGDGFFKDFKLNEEGERIMKLFTRTIELNDKHISTVFIDEKIVGLFEKNVRKALETGEVHTQNFIIPFIIGKTDKKRYFENRYSRINSNEVIVITRDVTDKVEFETQLIESVNEKEILLKEVHHRVKNNLQVISSILNLQSSYVEDEKTLEIINESQNRIRSMSYIHESLYKTKDFSSINFRDYITNLVQNLVHSYQIHTGKTELNLTIDAVELVLDQAIPCGLILNELVSNSLKYAYPNGQGLIEIAIKEENEKVVIRVEDFGVGLPEAFKIEESESLGLGLVDTLVEQLNGELILKTDNGTKYLIIFEKQDL